MPKHVVVEAFRGVLSKFHFDMNTCGFALEGLNLCDYLSIGCRCRSGMSFVFFEKFSRVTQQAQKLGNDVDECLSASISTSPSYLSLSSPYLLLPLFDTTDHLVNRDDI